MGTVTVQVNFMGELRSAVRRRDMEVSMAEDGTVQDLLESLVKELGDRLKNQLFGVNGALQQHVSIFVGGTDIKTLAGLDTRLAGEEVDVLILPTYGGG